VVVHPEAHRQGRRVPTAGHVRTEHRGDGRRGIRVEALRIECLREVDYLGASDESVRCREHIPRAKVLEVQGLVHGRSG